MDSVVNPARQGQAPWWLPPGARKQRAGPSPSRAPRVPPGGGWWPVRPSASGRACPGRGTLLHLVAGTRLGKHALQSVSRGAPQSSKHFLHKVSLGLGLLRCFYFFPSLCDEHCSRSLSLVNSVNIFLQSQQSQADFVSEASVRASCWPGCWVPTESCPLPLPTISLPHGLLDILYPEIENYPFHVLNLRYGNCFSVLVNEAAPED